MHLFNFALPVSWWLAHGHCAHATWESIKVRLIFLLFTTQKTEEFLSPKKSSQPRWCKVIFTRNLCSRTWKMCCDSSCGRTLLTAVDSKQGPPVTRTAQSRVACLFFLLLNICLDCEMIILRIHVVQMHGQELLHCLKETPFVLNTSLLSI